MYLGPGCVYKCNSSINRNQLNIPLECKPHFGERKMRCPGGPTQGERSGDKHKHAGESPSWATQNAVPGGEVADWDKEGNNPCLRFGLFFFCVRSLVVCAPCHAPPPGLQVNASDSKRGRTPSPTLVGSPSRSGRSLGGAVSRSAPETPPRGSARRPGARQRWRPLAGGGLPPPPPRLTLTWGGQRGRPTS